MKNLAVGRTSVTCDNRHGTGLDDGDEPEIALYRDRFHRFVQRGAAARG